MSEDKGDKWEMPKPIFRQSSGSLPKGFAKKEESWDDTAEPHQPAPTPRVQSALDPKDEMLITMYAPPGALAEEPFLGSEAESETAKEPAVPAIPAAAIEEQPSISEQFAVGEAGVQPVTKVKSKRGGFGKVVLSFSILILLAALAGIGVLVYYFYFNSSVENSNF